MGRDLRICRLEKRQDVGSYNTYLRSRELPHPHERLLLLDQNALVTSSY
ncbi:MAG TPA: hypothetical protein VM076_11550 [Gemmatimonadaceae bacterium]|nr:hypothetical protein [Gemmatimonadaceae bacterium]